MELLAILDLRHKKLWTHWHRVPIPLLPGKCSLLHGISCLSCRLPKKGLSALKACPCTYIWYFPKSIYPNNLQSFVWEPHEGTPNFGNPPLAGKGTGVAVIFRLRCSEETWQWSFLSCPFQGLKGFGFWVKGQGFWVQGLTFGFGVSGLGFEASCQFLLPSIPIESFCII